MLTLKSTMPGEPNPRRTRPPCTYPRCTHPDVPNPRSTVSAMYRSGVPHPDVPSPDVPCGARTGEFPPDTPRLTPRQIRTGR